MVRPVEPDGRGGVRDVRPSRPPSAARRVAAAVADDIRVDVAAGREVVADIVRSAPRDAVRVGAAASVAAAPAARYVYDRAIGWIEVGIGAPGGSGSGRGPFLAGWLWSRGRRWRLGVERWENAGRRGAGEVLSDTAGAVWSSLWRRGA